ncbi:MAG: MutS protein msh4 [Trizodia sp. TS-e1964]|nr:MAG: MutS protein msh4 [Trizodia sp. TS-e1964]
MGERIGVKNLHLAVDMTEANRMRMLYKVEEGLVSETHYGLALAKVIPLPPLVIETAIKVSEALAEQISSRKNNPKACAITRRRKLVLGLKENLIQTRDGPLCGKELALWLLKLQEDFVNKMDIIDADIAVAGGNEQIDATYSDADERSSSLVRQAHPARVYLNTNMETSPDQRSKYADSLKNTLRGSDAQEMPMGPSEVKAFQVESLLTQNSSDDLLMD